MEIKRLIAIALLKMCGKAIVLTVAVGIVIVAIAMLRKWDSSLEYSNAFFVAGCLVIIGGASSRMAAGPQWNASQLLYAESFREMSSAERANFILDVSSPVSLVILAVLSGIMLITISVIMAKMF